MEDIMRMSFDRISSNALREGLEEMAISVVNKYRRMQILLQNGPYECGTGYGFIDACISAGIGGEVWNKNCVTIKVTQFTHESHYAAHKNIMLNKNHVWNYATREAVQKVIKNDFIKRRAKEKARMIGLTYWPALLENHGVDPMVFVAAERVLQQRHGLWGDRDMNGIISQGGWDMMGQHGASPTQVATHWKTSGCKDSQKFRFLVMNRMYDTKKGDSITFLRYCQRGLRWLVTHADSVNSYSRKAVAALGRISAPLRWAAISELDVLPTQKIRIRDLNWAAVKTAQKGSRSARAFMPEQMRNQVAWVEAGYFDYAFRRSEMGALLEINPTELRIGALNQICESRSDLAEILPAAQLVRLFGADVRAIRQFVGERTTHDAGQFTLPKGRVSPAWGQLVLQAPSMINLVGMAHEIETMLGRVPSTVAEVREVIKDLPIVGQFGILSSQLGISAREESDYTKLFSSSTKQFVGVPAPGGFVGLTDGEYTVRQLGHDDPAQPLAGRLVDCCQHLHGAAASCAMAAWQQGNAAIWAVYKGRTMVGQSFVWRSKKGTSVVLDSVECLYAHAEKVGIMMQMAAKAVVGIMGVNKVFVGNTSYGASHRLRNGEMEPTPECSFALGYSDAFRGVYLVAEVSDKVKCLGGKAMRKSMAGAVAAAQDEVQRLIVNELQEDSGVGCEHCGAEVHPMCEVCPSCGANIAEWVE